MSVDSLPLSVAILVFSCHSATQMSLAEVVAQNLFNKTESAFVKVPESFAQVLVNCRLAYAEHFRRLSDCTACVYHIIGNGYHTFFNLPVQYSAPVTL